MKKNDQRHPAVLVVLASQIACLTIFAFAEEFVEKSKWMGAWFGLSFLFGLILTRGHIGMWRNCSDERSLVAFLMENPTYLAVAIATLGQLVAILTANHV
ncbi:hypothetical protein [Burkholderia sp. Ac-20353]|uniref:hypothetical protein n=1 Tax=Burkholderia sp. Ac-20353 TaxID=2703894 RepID=UPI00197C0532|nr:hypothetical protein [Burkholderia sp. Ac-20353]MBN3793226.1 hypothetical protein [Burkholderia sp. Ac-20353]